MILEYEVNNLEVKYLSLQENVVADSVNYLKAHFIFKGDVWDKITKKTAVFRVDDTTYTVILDSNNECIIPAEALQPLKTYVGVTGSYIDNASNVVSIATKKDDYVWIDQSILSFALNQPQALTPTQYEQIMALINSGNFGGGGSATITYDAETETLNISNVNIIYDAQTEALTIGG